MSRQRNISSEIMSDKKPPQKYCFILHAMLFPLKTKYELCIPIKKDNSNECVLLACSFFFPLPYHSILTRKESSTGKRQWEIKNKKKERRKKCGGVIEWSDCVLQQKLTFDRDEWCFLSPHHNVIEKRASFFIMRAENYLQITRPP